MLNIGSVNAYSGEPNLLAYSMSKGGLMTMTRNLGDTLHREYGVRVNQINPGWVLTEREIQRKREHGLNDDWYTALPRVYAPCRKNFFPEEIAAAAICWLADECGPVSGQVFDIEQHPLSAATHPKMRQPFLLQPRKLIHTAMPRLAAFPKAYMKSLCIDGSMRLSEWIEMACTLDIDGLEWYAGFLEMQSEKTGMFSDVKWKIEGNKFQCCAVRRTLHILIKIFATMRS